jgi:hypothetical protein
MGFLRVGDRAYLTAQGLSAWHYPGQNDVRIMNACEGIATALANGVGENE